MSTDNSAPLLIAKDVAEMLAIPVSTLRKNVSVNPSAVPPFLKLGTARNAPVRWREVDVTAWIEARFKASNENNSSPPSFIFSEVKLKT